MFVECFYFNVFVTVTPAGVEFMSTTPQLFLLSFSEATTGYQFVFFSERGKNESFAHLWGIYGYIAEQ